MNERERFDECFKEYWNENPDFMINKEKTFYFWQARAEIAKQDEKELIEALIRICKITIKLQKELPPNTKWWSLVNENVDLIDIIEKHTSKTWEELNG